MERLISEPLGTVSKESDFEVERLFALLQADDAINYILIPKLANFSDLENLKAGDNAQVN